MPLDVVVPDASVILKWVLPADDEPDSDRATLLRDAIVAGAVSAVVPSLWWFEIGNTLGRRFPAQASDWISALIKFGLDEAPCSPAWLERTLALMRRYDVTFYDASYHALALVLDGVFVTADVRYASRAAPEGAVVALGAWTTG